MNKEQFWKALTEPLDKRCHNCKHKHLYTFTQQKLARYVCDNQDRGILCKKTAAGEFILWEWDGEIE